MQHLMTPSKRIGKYPVIREIGNGAMGKVYEGFDPESGEKVAIKILRAEHLADNHADSPTARFWREAQVGLRLRHPNIVGVHEYGEQGRIKFIAMQFIDGQELRQLMRQRGRFELDDAVSVIQQLLDALDCSHRHGVVHRDIKPSNLMVVEPLLIKVMDFGIARIESAAFTQVGTLLGTPSYMSPEQMCGEPVDGRADLWAAGVILYELLTGSVPFAAPTSMGLMRNVMQMAHAPVCDLQPHLPAALDHVLARALAKRREDRYQTATEFANALNRAASKVSGPIDFDLEGGPVTSVDLPLDMTA
jgi:serine/threonine-protein kinase